jgi:hypothetical protein
MEMTLIIRRHKTMDNRINSQEAEDTRSEIMIKTRQITRRVLVIIVLVSPNFIA